MSGMITSLYVQKRDPNRLNIELDGEYAFGLNRLSAAWLHVGQVLTDQDIQRLQKQDDDEKVYQAALHLINHRPRSSSELSSRLIKKGYSLQQVDGVISRMISNGILNDQDYAESYIRDRASFHPRSKRLISLELRQKGISGDEVQEILQNLPDDETLARQAAEKVIHRWSTTDKKVFDQKCSGFLARKGFGYGTISAVLPILWQEIQQINENVENR